MTIDTGIALKGSGALPYLTVIEEIYHAYQQQEAEALLGGAPKTDAALARHAVLWLLGGELYLDDKALASLGVTASYKANPLEVDGASLKKGITDILIELKENARK